MTTQFQRLLTALFSAGLAALLGLSIPVHAGTGSGGGATVSGTDDGGSPVSFSSDNVTFTMESETAAPLLSGPTEMPALEGDEIFFHYFIMSRANGEDTYTLSSSSGTPDNVSAPGTVTFIGNEDTDGDGENDPINTVTLGGTVASASATTGAGDIVVPDDDDLTDNISNGIATGDEIVINGDKYQVTNVSEGTTAGNLIYFDPVLSVNLAEGTPISEIADFDVQLSSIGSISDPAAPLTTDAHAGEVYIEITATSSDGDPESENLTAQVYTAIPSSSTTYIRNLDPTKNSGGAAYTSLSGASFYSSGAVTAGAGDTLEYAIVAEAGTANSSGVSFSVTIPSSTPYVAASTLLNNTATSPTTDDVGTDSALENGMAACDQVSCILGLDSTLSWGGTAEATFQVQVGSALNPTAFVAPSDNATVVAWTSPDDACWDEGLSGWANGECMMGQDGQAYCNTYADLQATGSFDYDTANSVLKVLLSCE